MSRSGPGPRRPYRLWRSLASRPFGRWLFTRMVCLQAPYFGPIRPLLTELEPGRAFATMRKPRRVQNHLGTVHALAMGNLAELVAGLAMEATLDTSMRWIPRGMRIEYLRKAATAVTATACVAPPVTGRKSDVEVAVSVTDAHGGEVVRAVITMYVSPAAD